MLNEIKHPHLFGFLVLLIAGLTVFLLLSQNAQSKIKIIDVHEHIESLEKSEVLKLANTNSDVEKTILIPSPIETLTLNGNKSFTNYRKNVDEILEISETYPDSFIPFCTISPMDTDALEYLQECIERGGKGLKLYNGHSYYYEVFDQPLDSERMMPVYAYAERNKIPLLFHINITKYENELRSILDEYPDLVVNVPHFMVSSIGIDKVAELFDEYPNLYTDVSFGSPEYMAAGLRRISNDTEKYISFMKKYSDRVLFGTDMVITEIENKDLEYLEKTLECYKNMLEEKTYVCQRANDYYKKEAEKYTEIYENCEPKEGNYCASQKEKMESRSRWYEESKTFNGLNLSDEILQKIYQENPLRFLNANQEK